MTVSVPRQAQAIFHQFDLPLRVASCAILFSSQSDNSVIVQNLKHMSTPAPQQPVGSLPDNCRGCILTGDGEI